MAYTIKKTSKADGVYYLAAWRAKDISGKTKVQYERYTGPDGKRGAQKLATLREAEASNQYSAANRQMTVATFILSHWLPQATVGLAYSTRYSKEHNAGRIVDLIGTRTLGEVSAMDLNWVQVELSKGKLDPATVANVMKLAKRIMRDAHAWNLIPPENRPWEGVRAIKARKAPPRVVTREQALAAAEKLRETGQGDTADLITVLTYTGLRLGEALGLHWDDIDYDRGTIRIWRITARTGEGKNRIAIFEQPKTDAGRRTLPMARAVEEVFRRREKVGQDNPLVFPDTNGNPRFSSDATKPITRVFRSLGITGTAHGLRHGAITHMLEKGIPLNQVSKLAGHGNTAITARIYLAWADDESAMDAMRTVMDD